MPGFVSSLSNSEEIVFAENADFSGNGSPSKAFGLLTNGQLWIGSSTPNAGGTHINVGVIRSPNGTIDVGHDGTNITLDVIIPDFKWNVVTSADNPVNLVSHNGYIAKGASPVHFILPASASIGGVYWIKGYGNLWTLAQNASQTVSLGIVSTLSGISGSVAATQVKDSIEILCVTANTEFEVIDSIGNPTFI